MARAIRVLHRTEYTYDRPVALNPHTLMLRPRDAHDLWLDDAFLTITPPATLRWYFDTFGNSIAEATFHTDSDRLLIESELLLRRYVKGEKFQRTAAHVCPYPFSYCDDEREDLAPFLGLENPGDGPVLDDWIAQVLPDPPGEAFTRLNQLSDAIHRALTYFRREEMGTQSAGETLAKGGGTCRDYALLFMEAARRLGFAARFVTGYLNDETGDGVAPVGGGATHAWADVYLPREGWIEFDPTNRITAGSALIRLATTRRPSQASPVSGSFVPSGGICTGLSVSVLVSELDDA